MNWDYIAGLFDGDGMCRISFNTSTDSKKYGVAPVVSLDVSGDVTVPLREFLLENECISEKVTAKRKHTHSRPGVRGDTVYIRFQSWSGIEIFVNNVLPRAYIKKKQLLLMLEAIKLRNEIKEAEERMCDNLDRFDIIRKEFHKLARKGPKVLKEYNFSNGGIMKA